MKRKIASGLGRGYGEFMALSDELKARETAKFDREFVAEEAKSLAAGDRQFLARAKSRAKARMGRPKVGAGVKVISLSVEKSLLRRADAKAKSEGISRAQLFSRGVGLLLGVSG